MLDKFRDKFLLEIVVFVSGAVVMIYEIVGSRILAPYIGTSSYIWTSLIGVILGSLSLGYWLGGRMADRKPELKILAGVVFLAAALVTVMMLVQEFFLSLLATTAVRLELKAVLAALVLFAPASVLFGFVTPYAVRLKMISVEDAGKTVGRLYALSTVGSILGTFLAGFVLLPFVGSVRTLYLLVGVLFGLSVLIAPFRLTPKKLYALILFPFAVGMNEFVRYSLAQTYELHDVDTEYSRVRVLRSVDKNTGRPIRALTLDPFSTQSAMFLDGGDELVLNYTKFYHLLRHFRPDFQKTLIIGGAGYSFPQDYLKKYPGRRIDVVEIDPRMTQIAREFFGLEDDADLRVLHEDGRTYLNRTREKYDAVLIDAFGSVYSVPFQLTTVEAAARMKEVLTDRGVVIVNVISAIEGEQGRFFQAEYKTLASVFPRVILFKTSPDKAAGETQNLILVASKSAEIPLDSGDEEISAMLGRRHDQLPDLILPVLTDDLAPVEYYNSFAQEKAKN